MKLITFAALTTAFAKRYAKTGTVDLEAAAVKNGAIDVEAAAFRPFSAGTGKIVPIKALSHFFVAGQCVTAGDVVEVPEADARYLVRQEQADFATDADITAAQKGK